MKLTCICGDKREKKCPTHGTIKNKLKELQGKRTSEGYVPEPTEKVELRGD